MRRLLSLCLFSAFALLINTPASAQLVAAKDGPIVYGHYHVNASNMDDALAKAHAALDATRPTAVNLRWALDDLRALLAPLPQAKRRDAAYKRAAEICDEDVEIVGLFRG